MGAGNDNAHSVAVHTVVYGSLNVIPETSLKMMLRAVTFSGLPLELLEEILLHMDLVSRNRIRRVSRYWKWMLSRGPQTKNVFLDYESLYVSGFADRMTKLMKTPLSPNSKLKSFESAVSGILSLTYNANGKQSGDHHAFFRLNKHCHLRALLKSFTSLTHLTFRRVPNLNDYMLLHNSLFPSLEMVTAINCNVIITFSNEHSFCGPTAPVGKRKIAVDYLESDVKGTHKEVYERFLTSIDRFVWPYPEGQIGQCVQWIAKHAPHLDDLALHHAQRKVRGGYLPGWNQVDLSVTNYSLLPKLTLLHLVHLISHNPVPSMAILDAKFLYN